MYMYIYVNIYTYIHINYPLPCICRSCCYLIIQVSILSMHSPPTFII